METHVSRALDERDGRKEGSTSGVQDGRKYLLCMCYWSLMSWLDLSSSSTRDSSSIGYSSQLRVVELNEVYSETNRLFCFNIPCFSPCLVDYIGVFLSSSDHAPASRSASKSFLPSFFCSCFWTTKGRATAMTIASSLPRHNKPPPNNIAQVSCYIALGRR